MANQKQLEIIKQDVEVWNAWRHKHSDIEIDLTDADLTDVDLERAYRSTVDPRLNYEQSLELALLIVRKRGVQSLPL
mgnify:CR=1 FL=1